MTLRRLQSNADNPVLLAVEAAGSMCALAKFLGLKSEHSVRRWVAAGRFPRTEWTGETDYIKRIARRYGLRVGDLRTLPS